MGKYLGQHFLHSRTALEKIVSVGQLKPSDTVFEIGAGEGQLTQFLLEKAGKVIAIEKDAELAAHLRTRFASKIASGKLILLEKDVREIEKELFSSLPDKYILIANIPYYLTGHILKTFIGGDHQPVRAVFLLQKEVVDRIVAVDGKESILSLSLKAYGEVKKIGVVKKNAFIPAPKVDSAILSIENISRNYFSDISKDAFFKIIKRGFGQKRKKLISNLKPLKVEGLPEIFKHCEVSLDCRAEDLSLSEWRCLVQRID